MKIRNFVISAASVVLLSAFAAPVAWAQEPDAHGPGEQAPSESAVCNQRFLTFPAWYRGIVDNDCNVMSPSDPEFGDFGGFIWRIVINLVEIILNAVGYAAVAFIIYGGYKYMISAGSPDGMVAARKTIMNACIGLVISVAAVGIINTIANAL